jgi:hypothetical protein
LAAASRISDLGELSMRYFIANCGIFGKQFSELNSCGTTNKSLSGPVQN